MKDKMVRRHYYIEPKWDKHVKKVAKNKNITESQVVRELMHLVWSK